MWAEPHAISTFVLCFFTSSYDPLFQRSEISGQILDGLYIGHSVGVVFCFFPSCSEELESRFKLLIKGGRNSVYIEIVYTVGNFKGRGQKYTLFLCIHYFYVYTSALERANVKRPTCVYKLMVQTSDKCQPRMAFSQEDPEALLGFVASFQAQRDFWRRVQ